MEYEECCNTTAKKKLTPSSDKNPRHNHRAFDILASRVRTPDQGFPTFWAYFVRFLTKHFSKISQNVSESGSTLFRNNQGSCTMLQPSPLMPSVRS